MAQPFDFTTPITENTTLVARYRCGEAPYAGKWFRYTMTDGTQYVPDTLENAMAVANVEIGPRGKTFSLINVSTGEVEVGNPQQIKKIELGGGWGDFSGNMFPLNLDSTASNTVINLRNVTGTPSGLNMTGSQSNGFFLGIGTSSMWSRINIDLTGLKIINLQMFNSMTRLYTTTGQYTVFSWARAGTSATQVAGIYGIVEPIFSASMLPSDSSLINSFMSGRSSNSLNYSTGIGFMGQYAQEWLSKFPTLQSTYYRTTYLA